MKGTQFDLSGALSTLGEYNLQLKLKLKFIYIVDCSYFGTGLRNGKLTEKDIYQTKSDLSSLQLTNELSKLWTEELSRPNPSIARVGNK
uniref:Uncharacterized protein n=1 Tax=Megaselia scalaris TaxID=36166 RepID=T1GFL6_MEGSC